MKTALNAGFLSFFMVYFGSYFFCYRRRDYQEQMIEVMMKFNAFDHASAMPAEIPINEDHPFVRPVDNNNDESDENNNLTTEILKPKRYVAMIPERKEWQKQLPTQDASDIFKVESPKPK